jgi:uncharacterized protein YndB with AHSA1/START domain
MSSKVKTIEITVTQMIAASAGEVYDVWLDHRSRGSPWFGTAKAIVNPVVNGLFYHVIHFEGNEWARHDWHHYGRFIALDRPQKIQHTWVSEATSGLESLITLTFEMQGDQTLVKLSHANLPDDELGRSHEEGWRVKLGALADRFVR